MSNFQKLYKKDGIIYEARTCGGWRGEFVSFSEKDSNEIKIIHEDRFNEFIKDYEEIKDE